MLNLLHYELRLVTESRGIKGGKNMSKDALTKILSKPETSLSKERIKDIRENFNKLRDRFLKPKIKEIRKNLYEIGNKENIPGSKIKKIKQNLIELEESLSKLNKHYDYDDAEYKGVRDIENLLVNLMMKTIMNQ